MRVLLSGGTGLIGRALGRSLLADGHEVLVLTRAASDAPIPGRVVLRWDARSADGWWQAADGCDAIVHLAGETVDGRWTAAKKARIRDSRVESGRAVVEAVRRMRRPPAVLVQASGVGYYGDGGDRTLAEDAPAGTDFLGRLAVDWEAATAPVADRGVRLALARTGLVLAREGGALPRMALPVRLFAGGVLGSGRQWMPWIHRADEVAALRFLIETGTCRGPFNLVAPRPVTQREFVRSLARRLGRPARLRVPGVALRLLLGEMAILVLGGQRAVPRRLLDAGFRFAFPDLEGALLDLYPSRDTA